MGLWARLRAWFEPGPVDDLAPLRAGLAQLVKRSMEMGGPYSIDLFKCTIRGVPVGDWRITVEPVHAISTEEPLP